MNDKNEIYYVRYGSKSWSTVSEKTLLFKRHSPLSYQWDEDKWDWKIIKHIYPPYVRVKAWQVKQILLQLKMEQHLDQ